jgi:murein DD-endopeptidase MepM/ murein hydrolase activator NlpD
VEGVAFGRRLEKESRVVSAPPASPRSRSCPCGLLALLVGGPLACGARTHVETPGPVAAAAPAASADAGGGAATAARDGGAVAGNLGNGPAPGRRAASAATELRLPWSAGETWYLTSGPHSTKRSALDFAPPNLDPRTGKLYANMCSRERGDAYWVRAAADGYFTAVLRKGCPCVQIQHDDGTTTNYFHLRRSSVKQLGYKVGDPVRAGQALGHPSCEVGPRRCGATHPADGVHVHFHRTNAATGARLPADRAVLSGWTVKALGRQRDGMMTKGQEIRETRGKLLGWDCSATTPICRGKRNDLVSDNVPVPNTGTQMLSLDGGKQHRSVRR